jgi:uncharacterized protein YyaL (SSP411 family)
MRKTAAVALFIFAAGIASAQGLDWFKGSPEEAFAKAKAENKLVLVDFSSYT